MSGGMGPPPPTTPSPPLSSSSSSSCSAGSGGSGYPLPTNPLTPSGSGLSLSSLGGHHHHHSSGGGHSVPPSPDHTLGEGDEAVQATNDDASICKRSAIQLGYWADPFLQHFMRGPVIRKPPEINRGYYARTYGVYRLLLKTLEKIATSDVVYIPKAGPGEGNRSRSNSVCETEVQIINLGCGFDTLYWRLKQDRHIREKWSKIRISSFVDVDFPMTTMKKVNNIKNTMALLAPLNNDDGEISISKYELNAFDYHVVGIDLRDVSQLGPKLQSCGIKFDLPTIFLAECVLVYMDPKASFNLLKWINESFRTSLFLNYEQVNMTDRFAEVMLNNLNLRGCRLAGVDYCKDLTSQKQRFSDVGWQGVKAWTMNQVYGSIAPKEKERIESIEMLDEHELLKQLFDHYCIVVAYNDAMTLSLESVELQEFE